MVNAALTYRQRAAPPIDKAHGRRGPSTGGYDATSPRTLTNGIENEFERYPATVFDSQILRDRGPFYEQPRYVPPPVTWISWTAAGPTRPELHMRNATLRMMQGNTTSRYPVVIDAPTKGMHTMLPGPGAQRTTARYVQTPQMVPGRFDRLAAGQYSGQTYSQTTRRQGRS